MFLSLTASESSEMGQRARSSTAFCSGKQRSAVPMLASQENRKRKTCTCRSTTAASSQAAKLDQAKPSLACVERLSGRTIVEHCVYCTAFARHCTHTPPHQLSAMYRTLPCRASGAGATSGSGRRLSNPGEVVPLCAQQQHVFLPSCFALSTRGSELWRWHREQPR